MAITQADAVTAVRARLDEPSAVYWTDVDLRRWINDTARDMARRTECLRDVYNQAASAGTGSYTPVFTSVTQPYRIYAVEFIPTGQTTVYTLDYRDRNTAIDVWGTSQSQSQGTPAMWTSWGAPPALSLQVYPIPSVAGTLKLYYYGLPTILTTDGTDAGSSVDIVDGWEDVLVDGVEYRAKRRGGDSTWTEAKTEYEEHLAAMMESTLRYTDAFGVIATGSGGYLPAWLYGGDEAMFG